MSIHRKRQSLRESLGRLLSKKFVFRSKTSRLKGRYLFRTAVRLVLQYIEWLTEEPTVEEISDDVAVNVRMAQQKKVERKALSLQDRSILLTSPNERTSVETTHIFELFKRLRAFRKYTDDLRQSLAAICLYQYLPPGRVIVRQGREADNLYFIASGEVTLSRVVIDDWTGESNEIDMGTLNPGDMFGEIALLHVIPRTATVVSKTTVDLFLISRDDFDDVLREFLTEEWDILQDALIHFNYFKAWDEATIRECCILSRLKDYEPDEVLLGDGKGMVNYVHFVLEGECRLIEHMLVQEKIHGSNIQRKLYDPECASVIVDKETKKSLQKTEEEDDRLEELKYQASRARIDKLDASVEGRQSVNYAQLLLSPKTDEKPDDVERMSIVTTTLLDVVNEWHEITDVAAMLMKEPSSISQQCYPNDVRTIFMQICTFQRGACFGLGENMVNRRIVSVTPVRCFLIPRYWLHEHNRANIWERVKLFMDSKYPSREELFEEFVNNRKWIQYKENMVDGIIKTGRRIRSNVTLHDVPYSIRIVNDIN